MAVLALADFLTSFGYVLGSVNYLSPELPDDLVFHVLSGVDLLPRRLLPPRHPPPVQAGNAGVRLEQLAGVGAPAGTGGGPPGYEAARVQPHDRRRLVLRERPEPKLHPGGPDNSGGRKVYGDFDLHLRSPDLLCHYAPDMQGKRKNESSLTCDTMCIRALLVRFTVARRGSTSLSS